MTRPPHDPSIEEEFVVNACAVAGVYDPASHGVSEDDIIDAYFRRAWRAVLAMAAADPPRVVSRSSVAREIEADGGDPTRWLSLFPDPSSVRERDLADLARQVRVQAANYRVWALALAAAEDVSNGTPGGEVASRLAHELVSEVSASGDDTDWPMRLAEFPPSELDARPWLFEGSVHAADVMMIIAPAGAGKSLFTTQLAVCCAFGFDPFTLELTEPRPAMIVNGENDEQYGRGLIRTCVERLLPHLDAERRRLGMWNLSAHFVDEGMNLRSGRDFVRFERWLARDRPALVALGSLYTVGALRVGNETEEQAAVDFRNRMNRLIKRYGHTLVMEHHGTKADEAAPSSSHTYKRWPQVGAALVPTNPEVLNSSQQAFLLSYFRGHRGPRPNLPAAIRRPSAGYVARPSGPPLPEPLPWMPVDAAGAAAFQRDDLAPRRRA